jgi:hypothetical protein
MNRLACGHAVTALLFLGIAPRARAQATPPVLHVGQTITGTLSTTDPRLVQFARKPARVYRFNADSGVRYAISLKSNDFTPIISLAREIAGITDFFASGEPGEGLNALVTFRAPASGVYFVVATTSRASRNDTGAFTLGVEAIPVSPLPPLHRIVLGDSVVGRLDAQSATGDATNSRYDLYTVHAGKGQTIDIGFNSDSVRGEVVVGHVTMDVFVPVSDTVPDVGQSWRQFFTPPDSGDYTIRVLGFRTGKYALRVRDSASAALVVNAPIHVEGGVASAARDLTGVLPSYQNPTAEPTRHADWTFTATTRERLVITLQSHDFNTSLRVGRLTSTGQLALIGASDDAPGDGTNSRLALLVETPGAYLLQVFAADKGGGAYTLHIDTLPLGEVHLRRAPIAAGNLVSDSLVASDAMLEDGSPYQEWIYTPTRAREQDTVTMRSQAVDTYLSVGQMHDGKFVEFSSNDDAPGDTTGNRISRVVVIAPDKRPLVIRANTFGPTGGAYTIQISRSVDSPLRAALFGPDHRVHPAVKRRRQ